jgi:peptide/nickel transport system substrate-binding protein
MMKAGQADMAFTLSPSDAEQLKATGGAKVETMIIPRTRLLLLNCKLPIFSDVRVRQALSLAIDRQSIATGLLRNPESSATQLLPPAVSMWHTSKLKPLEYNPAKARKLLEEAGWKPGTNGILEKDGQRFEFELATYAARPMLPPIAAALQQQLKEVGIKMDINVGESSQIPDKRADGSLQAALLARNFGLIPDAIGTIFGDYGQNPGSWGAMGWQSDKLNQLLTDYLGTFDTTKAAELRKEITSILQTELPVIPVTWYEHIVAVSDRIEGVSIDPFEIKSYTNGARWVEQQDR